MKGRQVFEIWAPSGARWVDWVRPVPFVLIDSYDKTNAITNFTIPSINYVNKLQNDTAIFVDLPGCESITEALAIAKLGWRPIPVFNGTNEQYGAMALVNNHSISNALLWGADKLQSISIPKDAPPMFLLDSYRTHRHKINVSVFDNSWDLYPQDIPSAEYFLLNGINKILVRGDSVQIDLQKIFYIFQKKGIRILFTNGFDKPKEVSIKKPPRKYKNR